MPLLRSARALFVLGLSLFVLPAFAQAILPIEAGQPTLAALRPEQPIAAYDFPTPAPAEYTVALTFLGDPAPVRVEWYDAAGRRISTETLSASGTTAPIMLAQGENSLLIIGPNTASVTLRFTVQPARQTLPLPPAPTPPFETEGMGEDQIVIVPSGVNAGMPFPLSGVWLATWVDVQNNCPVELPTDEAWIAPDGSLHGLIFTDESALALEMHRVVAAEEIAETPEFFFTENEEAGTFAVIPRIQTEPYYYLYRVVEANFITLDYFQTLALSDCALYISVTLQRIADASMLGADGQPLPSAGGRGSGMGEPDPSLSPTPSSGSGAGTGDCGPDALSDSREIWSFQVPDDVRAQATYGSVLGFELRLLSDNGASTLVDLEVVANNRAVLYGSTFGELKDTRWLTFRIPLTEAALLENYLLRVGQLSMQFNLRSGIDQMLVVGQLTGANTVCLRNWRIE